MVTGVKYVDIAMFLKNALIWAGMSETSTNLMYLSPVVCFLTSVLFRFGMVSRLAIFIVCGFLGVCGNVGFYILLRRKFSRLLSLFGVVLYTSFYLVAFYWCNGMVDVAAVSLTVWVVLFFMKGITNPKYLLIAFPLLVLAFFTRYTVIYILPLFVLYFKRLNVRYLAVSLVISAVLFAFISKILLDFNSSLFFISQAGESLSAFKTNTEDMYYIADSFYFIRFYLGGVFSPFNPVFNLLSYVLYGLVALYFVLSFKIRSLPVIALSVAGIIFFWDFNHVFVNCVILVLLVYLRRYYDTFSLFVAGWFLMYFVFFSWIDIKVDRYIITTFIPLAYFVVLALHKLKIPRKPIVILLVILIIYSFAFTCDNVDLHDYEVEDVCGYLISYDADYAGKNITSFKSYLPYFASFYLNKDVIHIDKTQNPTSQYVMDHKMNITGYHEIYHSGKVYLYERGNEYQI